MGLMDPENKCQPVNLFFSCNTPNVVSDRPPIIFIHGLFSTNRTWATVKYKIMRETKRTIYSIDLRNHGGSEWADEMTLACKVADFENFMEVNGIKRALLIGHSVGGRVVMQFALKHPEMVEKIVVEDMTVADTESATKGFSKTAVFARFIWKYVKELPAELTESEAHKKTQAIVSTFYPQSANATSTALTLPFHKGESGKFVWDMNIPVLFPENGSYLHCCKMHLDDNMRFEGSALFLAGSESEIHVEDDKANILRYFPKAEIRIMKGANHVYHLENPPEFTKIVSNFINLQ